MSESEKKHKAKKGHEAKESAHEVKLSKKEHEELMARLKELEGMKEKLLRNAADYENAKKRLQREKEEFIKFSQENLLKNLLPVMDNFERALAHAGEDKEHNLKALVTGIQMVLKQMMDVLTAQGLKKIPTVGSPFDPHVHEAVAYVQEDGKEEVIDEIEPGYLLNDRLLRAAKVRVRIHQPQSPESPAGGEEKQEEIT